MLTRTKSYLFSPANCGLLPRMTLLLCVMFASQAAAQTTTAVQDTTCVGNRSGNLTCSAGEFAVLPAFSAAPGTPPFCVAGQSLNLDVSIQLTGSNTNRYDIGFFTGQVANDPRVTTGGNICSAAVVPPASFPGGTNPWYDDDGDTCGDLHETTPPPATDAVTWSVQNIKVLCQGTTSALSIPYVLSYSQTSSFSASCSALNVVNGAPSKCNSGTAEVNVGVTPLQVAGYVDVTKQTLPDSDSQSFSFTATGPAGSTLATSTDGGATIVSAGSNTVTVNRTDGQTVRIYMSVVAADRTLSIVEAATTSWETSSNISCAAVTGSPNLTTNNATRTATATLNTTNIAAACTFTNTKKSRVTIAKSVDGRVNAADQFTVSASAGVGNTLTTDAGVAASSPVSVSTSGAGTSVSTILRSTPGLPLTIADAMAGGSVSTLGDYDTRLTCTNAFAGSGATPNASLPSNSNVSTFDLTPAPGDDITCTYTNSPKPRISLQKAIAATGGGRVIATDQFALTLGTSAGTTTGTGSSITSGALSFVGSAGVAVSLSEAAAGSTNLANYSTSISCTNSNAGSATVLPNGSGISFNFVPASKDVISCTLTNTRKSAPLTLEKTWANAVVNNAVNVSATGIDNRTFASTANTGNETDTDATTLTVFAGETIALAESFTTGSASNYNVNLVCVGNNAALTYTAGNTSGSLLIDASDTGVTCGFINTRKSATLVLRKSWVDAQIGETATVTSSGFANNATTGLSTSAGNNITTGAAVTVFASESGTIGETLTNGANYNVSLGCTGNSIALSGNTLTIGSTDTAIICTQTNQRKSATLTITKQWVNGMIGDTATVSTTGFGNNATSTASVSSGNNSTTGPGSAVFAGESGTITESFSAGDANFYNTGLACSGNATPLSGNALTINAADTAISCTLTNTSKADMVVDVSGLPTSAVIGTSYAGSYSCTNAGGSSATSATCSINGLPAGLTSNCVPVPPANLAIGASITCTVSGAPTTAGSNNVSVTTSATDEGNTANNVGNTTISIDREADLSISKTDSPDPVIAGNVLTYTITVTNNGPSTINVADTFTVTDVLPSGLSSCSHTPSAGTYTVANGDWTGVSIASAGSVVLTIACTVDADFAGASLSNSASVAPPSGVSDPVTGNDSAGPVVTTVNREANLSISKTDGVATVAAGGTTSYTIVVSNAGPSFANNAVVTDTPSAGLVLTGVSCVSAGGASCPGASTVGDLTGAGLVIPLLPPGGTVTLTVTANVTATGQ